MSSSGQNPPPIRDPLKGVTDGEGDPGREEQVSFGEEMAQIWRDARGVILLLVLILATFVWQMYVRFLSPSPDEEMLLALSTNAIASGHWWTLVTAMFMHGGIGHLLMNLSALLPFGLILGRWFGGDLRGQLRFLTFYLVAGLCGDLGYLLILHDPSGSMVGASGAIFGLWGAIIRLNRDGGLHPLFSREVGRQMVAPLLINLLFTLFYGFLASLVGSGGIAWQAHVGGFVFGLLTIGLFLPRRQA